MSRVFVAAAAVAGLLASLPAAAQFQKPEDAVKYRKAAYTVMAAHFGRIGAMVNGKAPYDGAAAAANAEIVMTMSKLPFSAFPEGTGGNEKGQPKAIVWTEHAKFEAAAKKMQDAAAELASVAKQNNLDSLKAAFGATAKTCKGCHDEFRNP